MQEIKIITGFVSSNPSTYKNKEGGKEICLSIGKRLKHKDDQGLWQESEPIYYSVFVKGKCISAFCSCLKKSDDIVLVGAVSQEVSPGEKVKNIINTSNISFNFNFPPAIDRLKQFIKDFENCYPKRQIPSNENKKSDDLSQDWPKEKSQGQSEDLRPANQEKNDQQNEDLQAANLYTDTDNYIPSFDDELEQDEYIETDIYDPLSLYEKSTSEKNTGSNTSKVNSNTSLEKQEKSLNEQILES